MFRNGDFVNVKNTGNTYSTYMDMANALGADIDTQDWQNYDRETGKIKYNPKVRKSLWRYGGVPARNGIYIVKNIKQSIAGQIYVLIEHKDTRLQFVIGVNGLKMDNYLEDDLFEL
jgi:hypothetical protein